MNVNFRQQGQYIRCSFQYNKQRVTMLVQNVSVTDINFSKAKSRFKSSATNSSEYNEVLDKYANAIRKVDASIISLDYSPSKDEFKEMVLKKINGTDSNIKTFKSFVESFLNNAKNKISEATITQYKSTIKSLYEFEEYSKKKLTFNSFNLDMYDALIDYYYNVRGNSRNTVGNRIKHLKAILNNAHKRGLIQKRLFDDYKKPTAVSEDIALSFNECKLIQELELDNKTLNVIRDLFIVGCETGLRFGDYSNLKKEYFKDGILSFTTSKTTHKTYIAVSPVLQSILEKYDYQLPHLKHTVIFNKKIKHICKLAGINESTTLKKCIKMQYNDITKPKYDWVGSHTARRSFATNYYLSYENSLPYLMSITGHTTEKQFLNYVNVPRKDLAKSFAESLKQRFKL